MKLNICCVENLKHAVEECLNLVKMVHGPVCIIVPDKLSVTMEKTMFTKLNIEASFDIEVSTLTRLSQSILAETNVDFKPISKLGSVILIKKILNENKSNLKLFNSNYFSYSYSDVLFRTLTQFKSSKINSNDMLTEDINSPQLKSKIEDIRLILEEYESQKAGLVDSCDRLNLFAVNLHKSKKIKNTHFFFVGFDDLTTQGYSVVEELIKNSLSVSFMTYRSKHKNKHLYSNEVFEKLINICKISNLNYEVLESEYENNDLQKFISNNLLAINAENFNLNNNEISLHNAKNSLEEIEFVARDIRKQILKGHHFYEFGVGCFDLEKNANNIKNIFAKYDLNCYIDCSRPLISTSYYKFIENYIQLFVKNFQLENIISLINSEFIPFTNKTKNEINEILIELDYSGHLKYLKLDDLYSEEYQFLINLLSECEIKKEFGIFQLKDMINKLNSVLNIEEKILLDIDLTNDLNSKKILSQQIKAFNQLLDEISTFYPNAQIDEIYDIINSCAIEQKIMPIPQSIDS
ncbi:MAG: hypothetical protein IJX26_03450, partial [Clostridia bacterium]|nr:hypothetical protein [Clostridia bacterium]